MSISDLHVIVGLGATGYSCARYLKSQGHAIAVVDTRSEPPHLETLRNTCPDVTVSLGKLDQDLLAKADKIILSPGISMREEAIAKQQQRGVPIIGDIELFAQAVKEPIIAITGTNAKSTVTTLVGKMAQAAGLRVKVGGNLGKPVLDFLMNQAKTDLYVLELSSFQLETTYSLKPCVATVLNITPDHMDRYRDLAEYQQTKHRIYRDCQIAVCNRDDPLTECQFIKDKFYFTAATPREREFGLLMKDRDTYLAYEDKALLPTKMLPVSGKHYQENALAALSLGHGFGLDFESMLKVLCEFKGLPHRCQFVRERQGVKWYNDSKGTNVGATAAAIQGLGSEITGKLILIAGGIGKKADFSPLVPLVEKYVRHVVLIGEAAHDLANVIGSRVATSMASTFDDAIAKADQAAEPEDCVLLSPACASFDMFKNFEHRGEVFIALVSKL